MIIISFSDHCGLLTFLFLNLLFYVLCNTFSLIAAYSSHRGVESPRLASVPPCGGELLGFCEAFDMGRGLGAELLPLEC